MRMLAAPISPLDLTTISSGQFKGQVAGNEGIGIVEAKGSGVSNLKEGDTVVATLPGNGKPLHFRESSHRRLHG